MDTATEANAETIATQEVQLEDDLSQKYAKLEEEKNNYKQAYLKEAAKNKEQKEAIAPADEDKIQKIVSEALANSRLADIAREQDDIIQRALKENKELKLAQLNKATAPIAAVGAHSESAPVMDTSITTDQAAALKARGFTDKMIEAYKANLRKNQR